jgi:hypothetical protein
VNDEIYSDGKKEKQSIARGRRTEEGKEWFPNHKTIR